MARQLDVQYIHFYTDGSAARQIAPMFPMKKAILPKARKHKRHVVYIDPVATLAIAVAVLMLVLMVAGIGQFASAHRNMAAMERYVAQLSAEKEALTEEYRAGYDLEAVEKTALALGLVPKDQVEQITIQIDLPEPEVQVSLWSRIGTFLTGLFA